MRRADRLGNFEVCGEIEVGLIEEEKPRMVGALYLHVGSDHHLAMATPPSGAAMFIELCCGEGGIREW